MVEAALKLHLREIFTVVESRGLRSRSELSFRSENPTDTSFKAPERLNVLEDVPPEVQSHSLLPLMKKDVVQRDVSHSPFSHAQSASLIGEWVLPLPSDGPWNTR
ncbi:hypothetical protein [Rhizobium leguminosarum]|uniref:hypothetical protein n=1 Tax=Rhizobium TaxID=379 RepID=UPI001031176E|nr:hypothetical protein [Rhizobium leguminosarum]TBF70765.1 hypothetical protein ELG86_27780 [Rhizobium leguminosarum]TBG93365.1 hypothetical protein ELG70_38170 [Rhizobium leguminosarum]TBG96015.1 hypothetical protein ELG68_35695 [Rhizobium leguminosarum]TBH28746.1 hypothetical protein ELG66_34020 [Rhizobium leguminosarum]TBH59542.1 hypothetical protein ELG65_14550 [Rhizobium leguminosarum]